MTARRSVAIAVAAVALVLVAVVVATSAAALHARQAPPPARSTPATPRDPDGTARRAGHAGGISAPRIASGIASDAAEDAWTSSVAALRAAAEAGAVTVIDVRSTREYRQGHVPGAVRVSWLDYRDGWGRTGKLPDDLDGVARAMAALGVDSARPVVVYGEAREGWGEEGRVAWMLHYLGHPRVTILDGGWPAWQRAGGPVTREAPEPRAGRFAARPRPEARASADDVARAPAAGVAILDTRSAAEWNGSRRYWPKRTGRIPGAVHLEWRALLTPEGFVDRSPALRVRLRALGLTPERPVIAYCVGGVRSGEAFMVLRALGFPDVRNYDGSWYEWAADERRPVVSGGRGEAGADYGRSAVNGAQGADFLRARYASSPEWTMALEMDPVRAHTAAAVLRRIDDDTTARLVQHADAPPDVIARRLAELDREWDTDRAVALEAPLMGLTGLALGTFVHPALRVLPGVVASAVILYATTGAYPLLPVFRRLGLRTAREIERERYALKALRGDFADLSAEAAADGTASVRGDGAEATVAAAADAAVRATDGTVPAPSGTGALAGDSPVRAA